MKKINLSTLINSSCNTGSLFMQVGIVVAVSGFIWWCVNPSNSNQLLNVPPYPVNANVAQAVINQAPFGIIVKKVEVVNVPTIQEQVKVNGVYAAGVQNSIAFLTVETKHIIAKIGDKVLDGTLVQVLPDGVIINDGKQDVTIKMTEDTAHGAQSSGNQSNGTSQSTNNYSPDSSRGGMPSSNNPNNYQPNDGGNNSSRDDMISQRKKMIEQFQQQNSDSGQNQVNATESAR